MLSVNANAQKIDNHKAILACIGEAENQGYRGLLAVACAIRNRGTLHGVYGLKAPRVVKHLYSARIYAQAAQAWADSKYTDISGGATGWGNDRDVQAFKNTTWWPSVYFTAHIGDHWFYTTDN